MRLIYVILPLLVAADLSVVTTPLGKIRGVATPLTRHFFGVPYAEPPVGNNRFRPASPKLPWPADETLDATKFKPACMQPGAGGLTSSEDCLFLQVYTPPTLPPASKLPVFFWVHGGSFLYGTGADYNGTALANRAVVVTINYRMGPFGYLQSEQLQAEDPNWPSLGGLNGLNDALVALQWTRDNIAAFGGDPERITVAGESAGSLTVCLIAVSPFAKGKFRNVVLESGSCVGPWGPGDSARGLAASTAFMAGLNVKTIDELRALKASEILNSSNYKSVIYSIDGYLIPTDPRVLYASGNLSNIANFMVGSNTLDTLYGWPYFSPGSAHNQSALKDSLTSYFGDDAAAILQLYPPGTSDRDAFGTWLAINSDVCNVCPARFLADVVTKAAQRPVYLYQFGFNPGFPDPTWKGLSGHGMELPFVFESGPMANFPYDPALAHKMNAFWANFVQADKPLGEDTWPLFSITDEEHMYFDATSAARKGYRKPQCDYWMDYSTKDLQHFLNYVGFCVQLKL
jgi:para-nitrobenzyl esterase